jgi:hypothetical protein
MWVKWRGRNESLGGREDGRSVVANVIAAILITFIARRAHGGPPRDHHHGRVLRCCSYTYNAHFDHFQWRTGKSTLLLRMEKDKTSAYIRRTGDGIVQVIVVIVATLMVT